jgi:DNA-binding response OmpR family regulator
MSDASSAPGLGYNVQARVLVVDDEATHARAVAAGLRLEGFAVETAANAVGAMDLLRTEAFDLAIVDLMMPGTNGIQLARLIREEQPDMRVVLTSAYHLSERQLVNADCGAVAFVAKPLDPTALAQFLKTRCAGRSKPLGRAAS